MAYDDGIGADFDFTRHNGKIMVRLWHNDVRQFVQETTGERYITILFEEDDPLLSALLLKFKGREW